MQNFPACQAAQAVLDNLALLWDPACLEAQASLQNQVYLEVLAHPSRREDHSVQENLVLPSVQVAQSVHEKMRPLVHPLHQESQESQAAQDVRVHPSFQEIQDAHLAPFDQARQAAQECRGLLCRPSYSSPWTAFDDPILVA